MQKVEKVFFVFVLTLLFAYNAYACYSCITTTTSCDFGCFTISIPGAPGGGLSITYSVTVAYEYATCVSGEPGNRCWWGHKVVKCAGKMYLRPGCGEEIGTWTDEVFGADWGGDWCWLN
jgi:hypothetical protein